MWHIKDLSQLRLGAPIAAPPTINKTKACQKAFWLDNTNYVELMRYLISFLIMEYNDCRKQLSIIFRLFTCTHVVMGWARFQKQSRVWNSYEIYMFIIKTWKKHGLQNEGYFYLACQENVLFRHRTYKQHDT